MSEDMGDQIINAGVEDVDYVKIQTAEALEEAAQNLRNIDVSAKGDDIKLILHDIEDHLNQLKADINKDYKQIDKDYHKSMRPVEDVIIEHPIPSVLVAACLGALMGMLAVKITHISSD